MKTLAFQNPTNGFVNRIESPFVGTFLLGPLYIGLKGAWAPAIGYFLLTCVTAGLFWFVLPFLSEGLLRNHYLSLGWTELTSVTEEREEGPNNDATAWILGGLGICSLAMITLLILGHIWTSR